MMLLILAVWLDSTGTSWTGSFTFYQQISLTEMEAAKAQLQRL